MEIGDCLVPLLHVPGQSAPPCDSEAGRGRYRLCSYQDRPVQRVGALEGNERQAGTHQVVRPVRSGLSGLLLLQRSGAESLLQERPAGRASCLLMCVAGEVVLWRE